MCSFSNLSQMIFSRSMRFAHSGNMKPTKKSSCLVLIVALAVTLHVTAGGESNALLFKVFNAYKCMFIWALTTV